MATSISNHQKPLFDPSLIPADIVSALPTGYTIRPLQENDHSSEFLSVLRVLTSVPEITAESFAEQFQYLASCPGTYHIIVVLNSSGTVVGTGALVVERKFIHGLGKVGHIEDIAVARDQQGMKLGLRIIEVLDGIAKKVGCYKSILDCSNSNEGFYVKCGFRRAGLEMAHYYDRDPAQQ